MRRHKRSFILLELMIGLFLLSVCALPFAQFPFTALREEMFSVHRMQAGWVADLVFAKIKEKCIRNEIPWKEIAKSAGEWVNVKQIDIGEIGDKFWKYSVQLRSRGKKGQNNEQFYLSTFTVEITPKEKGLKLFPKKKERIAEKKYKYQLLLTQDSTL